jgi:hypothetical protein
MQSTRHLKWTPSNTWLTGLQRMPRTILPSIEQSHFILATELLEQRLHRGGSILSYSDINSSNRRRHVALRKSRDLRFRDSF